MTGLDTFGLIAVSMMAACDTLEKRNVWFTLLFAVACFMGSAYGFMTGAWPFGLVEIFWGLLKIVHFVRDPRRRKDPMRATKAELAVYLAQAEAMKER